MKKLTAWLLLLSVYVGMIAPAAPAQVISKAMDQKLQNVPDGLKFRLSEGVEGAEKREKAQLPSTDALSDPNSLLRRLPAIKSDPNDQTDFAKRVGSLPAPKTGNRIP